ncbi:MAG: GIY-YIG nuclease family protein [Dehalogenimonas sp.]|uniref:GIY-YIG nuclease family protein n=1 Tax=Candidatus Dehalogenimonas loeffleri TaxID=3127115 RepID=A0ABZ2J4U7_9CHLR|nr:GIY-YIG nuclease family protein [Dehalogenimonas sp.]
MDKLFCVYILANKTGTALYVGVTSNLPGRVYQHKEKMADGFTKKYRIDKLVWYEVHETAESAISREKKLKGSSRQRKINLINELNPEWKDLYTDL